MLVNCEAITFCCASYLTASAQSQKLHVRFYVDVFLESSVIACGLP